MGVTLLNKNSYSTNTPAAGVQSYTYNSPTGTNTMLVVVETLESFSARPTTNSQYYGGQVLTKIYDYTDDQNEAGVKISILANPPTGNNTLEITATGGSNGLCRTTVYTFGNINQQLKYEAGGYVRNKTGGSSGAWQFSISYTPETSSGVLIDGFADSVTGGSAYTGQTQEGKSSYKIFSSPGTYTMRWDDNPFNDPAAAHALIVLVEDKSFAVSDTITIGNVASAVKGLLIQVADTVLMSETYSQIRRVIISVVDTIKILNRGWFGRVIDWLRPNKHNTTWTNTDKS